MPHEYNITSTAKYLISVLLLSIILSVSDVQAAFVIACFTIVTILEREFRSEKDEE